MLSEIGELLVERTLSSVADSKSPVSGYGAFPALSKDYKEFKLDEVGSSKPDLSVTGSMIDAIDYKIEDDQLVIGVFGDDAPKADGHNNLSGRSELPTRRFIPAEGETYNRDIQQTISDVIRFYKAENAENIEQELQDVETKSELYDVLKEYIGDYSKAKLKQAALGSNLANTLRELDLLDLL